MTPTDKLTPLTLLDDLIEVCGNLSASAIRLLLVHARECLATGGDSTLTLDEAADLASCSASSAQKAQLTLARNRLVRRLRFGRNTHIQVLCISGLQLRGQDDLPLEDEPAASSLAVPKTAAPDEPASITAEPRPCSPAGDRGATVSEKPLDLDARIESVERQKQAAYEHWIQSTRDGTAPAQVMKLSATYSQLCTLHERLLAQADQAKKPPAGEAGPKIETPEGDPAKETALPSPSAETKKRELPAHVGARIRATIRKLPGISSPAEVFREIRHQVCEGLFADKDLLHATNICLKLLREGRWTTPWDYAEKMAAMQQSA